MPPAENCVPRNLGKVVVWIGIVGFSSFHVF